MYGPTLARCASVVAPDQFVITYAAHTAACTFLLDADGVCRHVVMSPSNKRRDAAKAASQCVGAQYVASLDGAVVGCLIELPRVGASMLFARVDERGRVALVRTGQVTRFEAQRPEEDPFEDVSVKTSAPEVPAGRARKATRPIAPAPAPDYLDPSDPTIPLPPASGDELKTEEYPSAPRAAQPQRATLPHVPARYPTTLRDPRVEVTDEDNPYARPARGMLPRSDPYMKAARSARPSSSRWATDAKITARRKR